MKVLGLICWAGAVICWVFAAYNSMKFNDQLISRTFFVPKGLSLRMALVWPDVPPECRVYRRKTLKWGAAFIVLLLIGAIFVVP
jgi:hypothetical protein